MPQNEFVNEELLLSLAGIEAAPGSPQARRFVESIEADSVLYHKALSCAVRAYLTAALTTLTPVEKDALRQRLGAPGAVDKPVPKFFVSSTPDTGHGSRVYIAGHFGTPKQAGFQDFFFDGTPEEAERITWIGGARIPEAVIQQYRARYNPQFAPILGLPTVQPRPTHYPIGGHQSDNVGFIREPEGERQ